MIPAHDADDLVALLLQNLQIIAVDLGGQLALHAADRLFHVVFDGLRKAPDDAGNFVEFAIHGGDQLVFILVKDRPPLFFGFQVDEVLGIEEAGRVRSVVRAPDLAGALRDLGKRAEHDASLVRHPNAFVGPGAGRECAAHPERAFIQVGQKLGTDDAAEGQINCAMQRPKHANTDRERTPANGPADGSAVALDHETP